MAITTLDGYIAAGKQKIALMKTASRTAIAASWFSVFDLAGNPGAGVLAGTSTTAGVVPTDATAGCPIINFSTGEGYLSGVVFGSSIPCWQQVSDLLWKAGAYTFTAATVTVSAPPSYSTRVPGGTDYKGLEIWLEVSTAFVTGTAWQVQVTYTNQSGTTGRSSIITAAMAASALIAGRMLQLGLQSGDSGVQKIESVIITNGGTAMTAGAFNILILRPLWMGRIGVANGGDNHALDTTGLPIVFLDSALHLMVCPDSTATGIPSLLLEIANG